MPEEKKAIALIDFVGGKALVEEPNGRVFVLERHHPEPMDGSGVRFETAMQPTMGRFEKRDAGKYPYEELYKRLVLGYERELTISLFLSMLDPDLPKGLRNQAQEIVEESFQRDEELRKVVEERLTSVTLPGSADITLPVRGKTAEILQKMLETRNKQ